jgi:DinB family protein
MSGLDVTLKSVLSDRFIANASRIRELAAALSEARFWQKPFTFGNSFGHLVLHLTGNLNYYIGAQIANNGYIRDRPREFTDASPPSKEEALRNIDSAIAMVLKTVREQSSNDWSREYSGVGTNAPNRLAMVMQCDSHVQHHIGQMIYIVNEWQRRSDAGSAPK